MRRYVMLSLENPLKPKAGSGQMRVLVAEGEIALTLPPRIAQELQLENTGTRPVRVHGAGLQPAPYAGPVKVGAGTKTAFTGAVLFGEEIVISPTLAQELGIEDAPQACGLLPQKTQAAELHDIKDAAHIMQVQHFIDADTCRMICEFGASQEQQRLDVVDYSKTNEKTVGRKVDIQSRDTFIAPTDDLKDMLNEIFYNVYAGQVEPFYGVEVEWWERPQLLCYPTGGKYGAHADADEWVPGPGGSGGTWKRFHSRDISVILYLNDDFTGGALNFPNHRMKVQPKPGLLVAFPSHGEYLHGAEPTQSGLRYALVSWAAVKGSTRPREAPYASIFMHEFGRA